MSLASDLSPSRCGRFVFVTAVGLFVAITAWLVLGHRFYELEHLGIATMQPRFVDAHVISGAGASLARGCDPLVDNPGDPLGRAMNYPRLWLLPAMAGLDVQHTWVLVAAFLAMFGVGVLCLVPLARTRGTALLLAAVLFSPVAWLAVERGNCDLLMFGLVAIAAWSVARSPRLAATCLGAAAALKLYPVFAVVGLLVDGGRAARRRVLGLLLAFAAYAWWSRSDLAAIREHTYHWARLGYGIDQLPESLAASMGWSVATVWAVGVALLVAALVGGVVLRSRRQVAAASPHAIAAFRMGAGIYVGSFCLGSNFDYRLVFLMLTVPQLVAWATAARGVVRVVGMVLIALIVTMVWGMTWRLWLQLAGGADGAGNGFDEVASWLLAAGLLPALVVSAPAALVPQRWREVPDLFDQVRANVVGLPLRAGGAGKDREIHHIGVG